MAKKKREQEVYGSYDSLKKENLYLRNKLKAISGDKDHPDASHDTLNKVFNELPFDVILLETTNQGISFHIRDINDHACKTLKGIKSNLLGKSSDTILHHNTSDKIHETFRHVIKTGTKTTLSRHYFISNKPNELEISRINENLVSIIARESHKPYHEKSIHKHQQDKPEEISDKNDTNVPSIGKEHMDATHLHEDLEKYKILIEQSPTGILELDKTGNILEYNPKADEIFKLTKTSKRALEEIPLVKNSEIINDFLDCLEKEKTVHGKDHLNDNDRQLNLKYHFSPLLNSKNQVYGLIGVFDDCTELSEMKTQLQESNEHYRDLLKLLPEVVFEIDRDGKILFTNEKAFDIFEYTRHDLKKGMNIFQCLHKNDRERAKTNIKKVIEGGPSQGNEYTAITKSGKPFPVLIYSSPIKKNGETTGLRGLIVTISKLKEAEAAIENSERNFRQLAENIKDGFWLANMENKILYANPACKAIAEREIPGITTYPDIFCSWIHPEDKERIRYEMAKNEELQEEEDIYEHRIITPSEKEKWLWIKISPIYNENNQIYRRAGIVSDITAHKKLIHELIKAKEKAEESDTLKSRFLANMSHEIRTPMNGILGFAELLKSSKITDDEREEYITIIRENGYQLLNLINDIIDIAKIEAGQLSIKNKLFDLNEFIIHIYHTYKKQYSFSLETIDFEMADTPPSQSLMLYSDPYRIQQILSNLLVNAFKFTSEGSIRFGYKLNYKVNKENYIKFFVSDTGTGIDKKHFDLIFDRFGQINKEEQSNKGTGLGLTICKNLVHLLGGRIWVDSELGKGTTFWFIIPDVREAPEQRTNVKSKPPVQFDKKDKTILIVEDDIINQKYLQKLLSNTNINLIFTKTGEKAVEFVNNTPSIDLILMDIRLPGISGHEAVKTIKKINSAIIIIAQTAYAMEDDCRKCLAMGFDDYISKPIDQNVLFEKLNHYLYTNKNN